MQVNDFHSSKQAPFAYAMVFVRFCQKTMLLLWIVGLFV